MSLIPKIKTDVQLNGTEIFDLKKWSIPYAANVSREFENRYNDIINSFNELKEEVKWNNIIYNKFKPVIGNLYYLYEENNDEYILSLISPSEWKKNNCVGTFMFDHNGKWNKIK